jgi:hypothetical protein
MVVLRHASASVDAMVSSVADVFFFTVAVDM